MRPNKISLKQAVAMLAATCTLGTCCIAGSVAWAVDSGSTENKVNTANINTSKTTSITLHKYEGPAVKENGVDLQSDGTDQSSKLTGKSKISGVEFTVWRVKKKATGSETQPSEINLNDAKGWEKIKDLEKLKETPDTSKSEKTALDFMNPTSGEFVLYDAAATSSSSGSSAASTCTAAAAQTAAGAKCVTEDGSVTLSNLPMGLYFIKETDVSNATVNGKKVSITKHVVPFFVTTPLPNPKASEAKDSWIYEVNVYPKNDTSAIRPKKEVEELNRKDFEVGDNGTTITWKISVPISAPKDGKKYTQIGFVDKLTNGLAYKEIKDARIVTLDEKGEKAKKNNTEVDDVVLNAVDTNKSPKYYTVDTNTTDVVKFTLKDVTGDDTGLAKALAAYNATVENNKVSTNAKQTATLVVELVTKFKTGTSARDFKNLANTFVDDNKTGNGEDTKNPCVPGDKRPECNEDNTPTDDAYFGTLTVNKYVKQNDNTDDKKKTKLPLNDAKFDLYEVTNANGATITKDTKFAQITDIKNVTSITTKPDSGNGTNLTVKKVTYKKVTGQQSTDTPVTLETKEKTEGTKKVEGTASVSLFVKDKSSSDTKLYCVVETEAPKGYLLDSRPHCIPLSANTTSTTNNVTTISIPAGNTLPVENKKATGMDQILAALPMTGARGLVILTLCGIVGLAGTFFYIVLKRRKEQEQA